MSDELYFSCTIVLQQKVCAKYSPWQLFFVISRKWGWKVILSDTVPLRSACWSLVTKYVTGCPQSEDTKAGIIYFAIFVCAKIQLYCVCLVIWIFSSNNLRKITFLYSFYPSCDSPSRFYIFTVLLMKILIRFVCQLFMLKNKRIRKHGWAN